MTSNKCEKHLHKFSQPKNDTFRFHLNLRVIKRHMVLVSTYDQALHERLQRASSPHEEASHES